jgi:hypothetical protein
MKFMRRPDIDTVARVHIAAQAFLGFCRKVAFLRPNEEIPYRKINGLRVSTFLFSVICDRTFYLLFVGQKKQMFGAT